MTAKHYTDSYYAQTVNPETERAPAQFPRESEVCVVGGGLAGLSTALSLAERGISVTVLEENRVGWGASGRNGGFVGAGFALGERALVKRVGLSDARELYGLSTDAVSLVKQRIARYSILCDSSVAGSLRPSVFDASQALQRERDYMAETFGEQLQVWSTEQTRGALLSDRYYGALFNPESFQFHPLNYCRGVAEAAVSHGVVVAESCQVTKVDFAGAEKKVYSTQGEVRCAHVVFTCGGYLEGLMPKLRRAIVPVATYVIATEPLGEARLNEAIRVPYSISDNKFANDYYRRLPDTRILWGGRISVRRSKPPDLSQKMLADLLKVYPQLTGIQVESAWHGLMSYATHKMPQIGQLGPGIWYAMGFGGHGMNTTGMAGELVGSAIADNDDRHRLFAPFGLTPTGGPIGALAAQLTYWYYQTKDALRGA